MLRVEQLKAGYGLVPVFHEVSFEIPMGKLVVLLGRNGTGKSTLLRCLSNLKPYNSGDIFIKNNSIKKYPANELAKQLSLVTTERITLGYLKVFELLQTGRHPHTGFLGRISEEDKNYIHKIAAKTGVDLLLYKNMDQLSDGERQKVMITRALVQDTPIILMDEPVAHLDLVNRKEIFDLLKLQTSNNNKIILMATHELHLALEYADEVLSFTGNGNVILETPEQLEKNKRIEKIFFKKKES